MTLQAALASIRRIESGSYRGDYSKVQPRESAGTPTGAYGILDSNWRRWASAAGLSGASIKSKVAQDRVAAVQMQRHYDRYGTWGLAIAAYYGGTKSADSIARRGGKISNPRIARYVKQVEGFMRVPAAQQYPVKVPGATRAANKGQTNKGWTFPVAGSTEWSGGSYMDKHTKGDRSHNAIDIYAAKGTPIISPVGGTITSVRTGGKLGGTTVSVQGRDGVTYYFAHMSKHAAGLERGQKIMAGHHLGSVGTTGSARGTTPHLHFSMKKNGKAMNPKSFLNGAETSNGMYADLEYAEGTDLAQQAALADPDNPEALGQSLPETMINTAANVMAGGKRLDPRKWIDPDVEGVDLEKTIESVT